MSGTITAKDIRKGDMIRKVYHRVWQNTTAHEYFAEADHDTANPVPGNLFLLDRPEPAVVLPTEPGHYLDARGGLWTLHRSGEWINSGDGSITSTWTLEEMHDGIQRVLCPFTLLRPAADVADEVIAFISEAIEGPDRARSFSAAFAAAKAKFGVTQ